MGATNRPNDLDNAILRRMPATFYIHLPEEEQRRQILELILNGESLAEDINISELALNTNGFSGSDLREMCRYASVHRIRDYIRNSMDYTVADNDSESYSRALRPISKSDLETALHKMRSSRGQFNLAPEIN
ncbi:hypothetical protein PGB90_010329 [Kerria lacca]